MNRIKTLAFVILAFISLAAFTANNDRLYEISKNIEIFVNIYKEINTNYVDDIDPSSIMRVGIDAMLNSLDPYTNYISEAQVNSYKISDLGTYEGIGASTEIIDDEITIVEPMKGSASYNAGLKAGDQILEVNGQRTKGKSAEDLNRLVRGVEGTDIYLKIHRPVSNETMDVTLTRGKVTIENVPYSGMVKDGVAYISLSTFTQNAGVNVAKALKSLQRENPDMTGVIFDLRQNGGGLLREAINVSNIFINKGEEIVSTRGKVRERDQFYKTMNSPVDLSIPLAVLIDNKSASASEIVSGTIQDLDRGILIGQRSFGKGLVQNTTEIGYKSRVKLTTSKYYISSGRCIQSVEYENGEPKDIPDEERDVFYTRNKRKVLDGGGVAPDIKTPESIQSTFVKDLLEKHVIFKYVNQFCAQNDSIPPVGEFKFSEYDDFVKFAKSYDYDDQTKLDKDIESLKGQAEKEGKLDLIQSQLDALKTTLEKEKEMAFINDKAEIIRVLESKIATRYYFQKGKKQQQLLNDPDVDLAIEILNDPERYNKILGK